jgi:hypothetical protein
MQSRLIRCEKALAFSCSKMNKGYAYIKIRVKLESYH